MANIDGIYGLLPDLDFHGNRWIAAILMQISAAPTT
jgi:hypothetical protein